jgi:hypothetical protein
MSNVGRFGTILWFVLILKLMKSILAFLLVCGLIAAAWLPAQSCTINPSVNFGDLIAHPSDYNSKNITIEGYYFSGFEISALAGGLQPASQPDNVMPQQPLIWITPGLPTDIQSQLFQQQNTPSGYTEYYGKVTLEGYFDYGHSYGHLNAYSYQLELTRAKILLWSPPVSLTAT